MHLRVIFLLISLTISSVNYAAYPDYIESDTIEDICKKISCHNQLDEYYRAYYYPRQFNKALAISYYKSGNRYINDYFGVSYQYSDAFQAKSVALTDCKKHGRNCEILLVNNRFENKDLYQKLTRSIPSTPSVSSSSKSNVNKTLPTIPANSHRTGNSWTCDTNYYKSGNACRRVPANASSTYNSNYFYCDSGFEKSGESCLKIKPKKSETSSIQSLFFTDDGPSIVFWLTLVLIIYFLQRKSRNSNSGNIRKKVVITKDTPRVYPHTPLKPKPAVANRKPEAIKKSPQTLLGKKREINKQLKNGLITKRTADSRIKKAMEAEEMRLILENINNKSIKKKVKSKPKPKIPLKPRGKPSPPSLKQAKVVIPKSNKAETDDILGEIKSAINNDDPWETVKLTADMGVAESQFLLATKYTNGVGEPINYNEGFKWALEAAKQSYPEAQLLVGSLYLYGHGTTKNIETGKEWLSKAAQSSNKDISERAKGIIEQIPITQLIDPEILKNMDPKWFK